MRLVIVDDDSLVQQSLRMILEAKGHVVSGVGSDGSEARALYEAHRPDVLLMDIRMKEMSGLDAAKDVLSLDPAAKILLITTFQDDIYIADAIRMGCRGYILKENISGIVPAIEAVAMDQQVFDSRIVERMSQGIPVVEIDPDLTDREKDILALVGGGLNNKEIAEKLFLSEGTVRNYISNLLEKLELRDRTQLAIHYLNAKHRGGNRG